MTVSPAGSLTVSLPRRRRLTWYRVAWICLFLLLSGGLAGFLWLTDRYAVADEMAIRLRELSNADYPEDPADRSPYHGRYHGRTLRLVRRDKTHFDFVFSPTDKDTAKVVFRNIDVSLITPNEPEWTKSDPNLERIALTDRQWNRQQVSFDPKS